MSDNVFTLSDFLPYLLNRAAERASLDFAAVYKAKYGMHRTDWRVLAHLGEFGPMSAHQICDKAGEEKTRVSRAVSRLESKGFLCRNPIDQDRRRERLELTRLGREVYHDLMGEALFHDRQLEESLGSDTVRNLRKVLADLTTIEGGA